MPPGKQSREVDKDLKATQRQMYTIGTEDLKFEGLDPLQPAPAECQNLSKKSSRKSSLQGSTLLTKQYDTVAGAQACAEAVVDRILDIINARQELVSGTDSPTTIL